MSEHDHEVERFETIKPWTNKVSASMIALADMPELPPQSLISDSCNTITMRLRVTP